MNNAKSWLHTKLSIFSVMPIYAFAISMFVGWLRLCMNVQYSDSVYNIIYMHRINVEELFSGTC